MFPDCQNTFAQNLKRLSLATFFWVGPTHTDLLIGVLSVLTFHSTCKPVITVSEDCLQRTDFRRPFVKHMLSVS